MKILLLVPSLAKGGAERVVSLLSKQFVKMGYEVLIVIFNNKIEYNYSGRLINLNTPASSNPLVKFLRLIQRFIRLKSVIASEKPDYIFSFMESCNFPAILTGYRVVVSVRNNPEKKHNTVERFLIRLLYRAKNIKKIVTLSKGIEEILQTKYNIKNTTTIYNPIEFMDDIRIKEDLSIYQPYILAVGRLHYQKNFEMLIRAFAHSRTSQEAKLLIAGDGELKELLVTLIQTLGVQNKVFLVGQKDNINDYYLQASMFVLSSRFEGLGNVLIEALYHNLPVISTDCPTGPNEIIKDGFNGMLVENENEQALSEAIDKVYFDKELQKKFKQNAKQSIGHLSVENIAQKWLSL